LGEWKEAGSLRFYYEERVISVLTNKPFLLSSGWDMVGCSGINLKHSHDMARQQPGFFACYDESGGLKSFQLQSIHLTHTGNLIK
jgi:hypothetical protein